MKRITNRLMMGSALLLCSAGAGLTGCDKSTIPPYTYETFDMDTGGDMQTELIPGAPLIDPNQQIDRAGRPLINNWLTNPFGKVANKTPSTVALDEYNKAGPTSSPISWTTYSTGNYFPKSLAVYDALLDTSATGICGNQILYASPVATSSYAELALRLSDDRLYLDTSKGACQVYFAVEKLALKNDAASMNDCGGRNPLTDVVDATLTLLAGIPVSDGLGSDPDGTASTSQFPFLLDPK